MDSDERQWVNEAIALCNNATKAGVSLVFVRKQDANDEADVVITNASSPEMTAVLLGALDANGNDD
jgi:hypothetical protein